MKKTIYFLIFILFAGVVSSSDWVRNYWFDNNIDNDLTIVSSNDLKVGGGYPSVVTLETDGDVWVGGDWYQQGDMFLVDSPRVNGSQIPYTDNVFNSGNSSHRWKAIYGVNFYGDGSGLTGIGAGSVEDVWINESGDTMTGDLIVNGNVKIGI